MHSPAQTRFTRTTRLAAGLGAGVLAAVGLVSPAFASPAPAAPVQTNDPAATCDVTAAALTWGVKESFRSYISGAIANGEWTVSDDMRYETPSFIWEQVTGQVNNTLDEGSLEFTGAVHFTGHDGAMTLDLADPAIEISDAETAYLVLTVGSADTTSGGESVEQTRVRTAKLDLAGTIDAGGDALAIAGAVPRLTSEGAAALNGAYGSYVAGEELDPIALDATVAGCDLGAQTATVTQEPEDVPLDPQMNIVETPESAQTPWLPIGIGAVALLVIGVTGGMLFGGRGKKNAAKTDSDEGAPE